ARAKAVVACASGPLRGATVIQVSRAGLTAAPNSQAAKADRLRRYLLAIATLVSWWAGSLLGPVGDTYASFNGSVFSTSNTFKTATGFGATNLTITGNCTTNGITLSWTAPSGSWASKYDVYEGASSGSLSVIVAGTTTTSISDPASNPLNSLPRYYKVRSYDAYGAGGSNTDSSVTSITVSPCSSLILESEYPAISQQNVATGTSSGKTFSAAFTFSQAIKTTGTGTPDSTMIK